MAAKRVLITGASRGLGRSTAELVAQSGGLVGLNYLRSEEAATEVFRKYPENIKLLKADIRDLGAASAMVQDFANAWGGIDVLVNNAGVHHPAILLKKSLDDIYDELATNLLGAIVVCHAVLPLMVKQRNGLILSISSVAAEYPSALSPCQLRIMRIGVQGR